MTSEESPQQKKRRARAQVSAAVSHIGMQGAVGTDLKTRLQTTIRSFLQAPEEYTEEKLKLLEETLQELRAEQHALATENAALQRTRALFVNGHLADGVPQAQVRVLHRPQRIRRLRAPIAMHIITSMCRNASESTAQHATASIGARPVQAPVAARPLSAAGVTALAAALTICRNLEAAPVTPTQLQREGMGDIHRYREVRWQSVLRNG